jgi:hypothetical protein
MELGIAELLELVVRYVLVVVAVTFLHFFASTQSFVPHSISKDIVSFLFQPSCLGESPCDVHYYIPSCILSLLQEKKREEDLKKKLQKDTLYDNHSLR